MHQLTCPPCTSHYQCEEYNKSTLCSRLLSPFTHPQRKATSSYPILSLPMQCSIQNFFIERGKGILKFTNQVDVLKNHTYCLQLGYIHSSRKQLMCSGQLVYTSPLLVVSTARYLWLCTCTAHLALSSKCSMYSSTIPIACTCMQDHDIRAPPLFAFYSAAGRRSTAL